jgi:hypothetical protein
MQGLSQRAHVAESNTYTMACVMNLHVQRARTFSVMPRFMTIG